MLESEQINGQIEWQVRKIKEKGRLFWSGCPRYPTQFPCVLGNIWFNEQRDSARVVIVAERKTNIKENRLPYSPSS